MTTNTFSFDVDALRAAVAKQRANDAAKQPKSAYKREKSASEESVRYRPIGYGRLNCVHDKSYFEPCPACRRSKADGHRKLVSFLTQHGVI